MKISTLLVKAIVGLIDRPVCVAGFNVGTPYDEECGNDEGNESHRHPPCYVILIYLGRILLKYMSIVDLVY